MCEKVIVEDLETSRCITKNKRENTVFTLNYCKKLFNMDYPRERLHLGHSPVSPINWAKGMTILIQLKLQIKAKSVDVQNRHKKLIKTGMPRLWLCPDNMEQMRF